MLKLKYNKPGVIVSLNMTAVEGVATFLQNPDGPIATLARRTLLTSSVDRLEMMYPGFQDGALLKEYYNPDSWRPTDEYMKMALFAGQETYEGLKSHFDGALGSFIEIHTQGEDVGSEKQARILYNVKTAMAFVESTLEGKKRRTGEPTMAHIYRVLLRMMEQIDIFNSAYNEGKNSLAFSSDMIELGLLTAILHDFSEDEISRNEINLTGEVQAVSSSNPDLNGHRKFLRIFQHYSVMGQRKIPNELVLYVGDATNLFLTEHLTALKKEGSDMEIYDDLQKAETNIWERFGVLDEKNGPTIFIPGLVKLADRADNDDTYWLGTKEDSNGLPSIEKLVEKANEGLSILLPYEKHRIIDRIKDKDILMKQLFSKYLYNLVKVKNYSKWAPSIWGKLVLLGLSPSQIYSDEPSKYGLPQLRI